MNVCCAKNEAIDTSNRSCPSVKSSNGKKRNDKHRLAISLGTTQNLKLWGIKKKETNWHWLCALLDTPTVDNSVTLAQYVALDKEAKNEKKAAAGNWNFGVYRENRRKKDQLRGRWGLVFDFDHATPDQIGLILGGLAEICQWEFHLHTTRSHTPEQPRWRLTMPFNRMATCAEAYAINRLVTLYIAEEPEDGVELVDKKSFENNQPMFKPSISKGQEFLSDRNEGEIFDVDAFLAKHPEWTDPLGLPHQADERRTGFDPDAKMEDPREKPEPIGAFCRAFTVEEAIAQHIPEAYEPDQHSEGRYRYTPADGASGAVVYDDGLFLQSHHANDPAEGQHNAFDLCRIHMYGHLDKNVREGTSPMNWPSSKAMADYANSLEEVAAERYDATSILEDLDDEDDEDESPSEKQVQNSDKTDSGEIELDDLDDEDEQPEKKKKDKLDMSWTTGFRTKGKEAAIEPVAHNINLICMNDPRITRAVAFNEFTQDPVATKQIKAKKMGIATDPITDKQRGYIRWEDGHDIAIQGICSAPANFGGYGTDFPKEKILGAVYLASKKNSFHPVRDMMERCHKNYVDGGRKTKGLIRQIPQRWLGCPDDVFHRESSRALMLAMVARTFEPGAKFDCVAIIRGLQGGGTVTRLAERVGRAPELPND